ncbi:MAG: SDR family oxidoreductase [Gemmatimonadota bacterium]
MHSVLNGQSILITGADGMLGRAFVGALADLAPGSHVSAYPHGALDVTDAAAVAGRAELDPDLIIHCGGLSRADECERNPARAFAVHLGGSQNIGRLALATGARVLYPQSVFIFDGSELPVTEETVPNPQMVYGKAKLAAEQWLLSSVPGSLSIRMAGFFGGDEKDKNFVGQFAGTLRRLLDGRVHDCEVGDRRWQPTYTLDLARNAILLLALERSGIYHMGSLGEASFFDVAGACVDELGLGDVIRLRQVSTTEVEADESARRPARMVTANHRLNHEGLNRQRPWREALREYLRRPHFDSLRRGHRATG